MRFSLQDIKKQVHRRGNTLTVSLHFLHPGELRGEIERLVSYHEQLLSLLKMPVLVLVTTVLRTVSSTHLVPGIAGSSVNGRKPYLR